MRFRTKIVLGTVSLMSILFGIGSTALVSRSFASALEQEEETAITSYRMTLTTLQILNESNSWSTEEGISRVLEDLTVESSWEAIRLSTYNEIINIDENTSTDEVNDTNSDSNGVADNASGDSENTNDNASDNYEDNTEDSVTTERNSNRNILYLEGTYTDSLSDLTNQADETHLAYTVIPVSDTCYYLQVSGICMLGNTPAYLDIAYDITPIYESRQLQQQIYMQIFFILLAACAASSYLLAFFVTRPLTRLSKGTRRIADGNYRYRSNIRSNDEIGRLSRDFDQMADHLEEHMEQMHETVDQLQETTNILQESMEQQNRFVGNFTHELKTPMTSIIGYADLLRRQNLSEEERADAANYIYKEGKRLEHLSMTLLQIFVMDHKEPHFTKVSPSAQIREIAQHYSKALRDQGIVLETDCQRGTCMLEADLFASLIVNLMENARRAIHSKRKQEAAFGERQMQGTLYDDRLMQKSTYDVNQKQDSANDDQQRQDYPYSALQKTKSVHSNRDFIRLTSRMTDTGCTIAVIDNGCGIPAESLSHLTEEFYRVDKARARAQGGAGLGLSLCHRIALLHHGEIHIESALSIGTIITVDLNAGREPAKNTAEVSGGTSS